MTDTAFYDAMIQLAQELLADFGTPCTLRRVTIGEVGADGKAPESSEDFPGLAVLTTSRTILDRLDPQVTAAFVYKGPTSVNLDDYLIHATKTWKVKDKKEVNPEGNRLIISFLGVVEP